MWYFLVIFNTKIIKSTKIIITIITYIIVVIIVTWFCNMRKNVVFDVQKKLYNLPKLPLPPPPPNSGKLYNFFWMSKTTFLRVLQNQVTMITTMMWVIIVIIILVLLMILVLKMTKKYHITWYWCQNIRDNMVEKRVKKFGQGPPPPLFGQCPKEIDFSYGRCSLTHPTILTFRIRTYILKDPNI